jgi:hypothetical protein
MGAIECNSAVNEMKRRHMVAIPLETQVWQTEGGNTRLLSATVQEYTFLTKSAQFPYWQHSADNDRPGAQLGCLANVMYKNTILVPSRLYQLHTAVPLSNYQPSDLNDAGNLTVDARCTSEATFGRYDPATGRLLEGRKRDEAPRALVYEAQTGYLLAQVDQAAANQVAYEGFEGGTQNHAYWTYTPATPSGSETAPLYYTGTKGYQGSLSTHGLDAALPAGSYTVSLWAKSGGSNATVTVNGTAQTVTAQWQYYAWTLASPGTVTIHSNGNLIDEVRVHPVGARMTTYSYRPLVGPLSTTDANNVSLFYEYDSQNRVKLVRDKEGNILKSHAYHHQRP